MKNVNRNSITKQTTIHHRNIKTGYTNGGGSGGSSNDDDRNSTDSDNDRMNRRQNTNGNGRDWQRNHQGNDIYLTGRDNATSRMIHGIIMDTPRVDLRI